MERQNITLSLPKGLIKQAKHLAIEKGSSVSGLVAGLLRELVTNSNEKQRAAKWLLKRMLKGYDLGTHGKIDWKREDLYDR